MDTNQPGYISQERYDELVVELNRLKSEGRQEIASRLKFAKELGDLSENSEYKEAREAQSLLEVRINELEELLRTITIVKKSKNTGVVQISSTVKVKKGKEIAVYTIVGSSDAKPLEGLISNESPIGRALLGKKTGDKVKTNTPKGEVVYEILEIS